MTDLIKGRVGPWTETDLIARLLAEETNLTDCAADHIERTEAKLDQAVESNKELTLQLLAVHGQAADVLDKAVVAEAKLTRAVEFLKTMADYHEYVIKPFLADLEKKK